MPCHHGCCCTLAYIHRIVQVSRNATTSVATSDCSDRWNLPPKADESYSKEVKFATGIITNHVSWLWSFIQQWTSMETVLQKCEGGRSGSIHRNPDVRTDELDNWILDSIKGPWKQTETLRHRWIVSRRTDKTPEWSRQACPYHLRHQAK